MLNKDEIENYLEGVSPELCVAFAVRSALRVLPLLAEEKDDEPFWYWPEQDRSKHFLAVLNGMQVGRVMSVAGLAGLDVALKAATAADVAAAVAWASAAATYSADFTAVAVTATATVAAVVAWATAATYAADFTDAAAATVAATAVVAMLDATRVNDAYTDAGVANVTRDARAAYNKALIDDLDVIVTGLFSQISDKLQREPVTSATELFQRPLWPAGKMPVSIQAKWQLLRCWAESLGSGFEYWLDWYEDCLDGKLVDIDLLKKQLYIPVEIRTQGVKAVNVYLATLAWPENKG